MIEASVIGAVNIDITGYPFSKLSLRDSNIGAVKTTIGGVGANIAQNLALLGVKTHFISAIGRDNYRNEILKRLDSLNIDYSKSIFSSEYDCGKYLSVLDENNDMICGINQMDINKLMNVAFFEKLDIKSPVISADCNLNEEAFAYVLKRYSEKSIIVVDAVSKAKTKKIIGLEKHIGIYRPNRYELGAIFDMDIENDKQLVECAEKLIARGVKKIFVSGCNNNIFAFDVNGHIELDIPLQKAVNTTGAGDCFTSAVIYASLKGYDLFESAVCAMTASAESVKSESAVNDNIKYLKI